VRTERVAPRTSRRRVRARGWMDENRKRTYGVARRSTASSRRSRRTRWRTRKRRRWRRGSDGRGNLKPDQLIGRNEKSRVVCEVARVAGAGAEREKERASQREEAGKRERERERERASKRERAREHASKRERERERGSECHGASTAGGGWGGVGRRMEEATKREGNGERGAAWPAE